MTDIAPSLTAPAPTMVAARNGKNMVIPFVVVLQEDQGKGESPAHPKTGRAFRKRLRRFQIIEPIASSKALVVVSMDVRGTRPLGAASDLIDWPIVGRSGSSKSLPT